MFYKKLLNPQKSLPLLASLCIGIILGAALVNILTAKKIDQLYLQKAELEVKVKQHETKLKNLSESLERRQTRVIENINLFVTLDDQHKKIKLEEMVNDLLGHIVGKDLNKVDPMLVYKILDNRIIDLQGESYSIKVELIVMDTNLDVFIALDPIPKTPES